MDLNFLKNIPENENNIENIEKIISKERN